MISESFIQALMSGNLVEDEARSLLSLAESSLALRPVPMWAMPARYRIVSLQEGANIVVALPEQNEANENSCTHTWFIVRPYPSHPSSSNSG